MTPDDEQRVLAAAAAILEGRGKSALANGIAEEARARDWKAEVAAVRDVMLSRAKERMDGLSISPIQAATRVGLQRDTFRNMFRDTSSFPRVDTLFALSRALDTTVGYLVGEVDQP